jgi:predicted nucleic acid-binding protein
VGEEFTRKRPNVPFARFLDMLISSALLVQAPALPEPISADPDDDKFIACALAGDAKVITSGDKHLLSVSGYASIEILRPRRFEDEYLN